MAKNVSGTDGISAVFDFYHKWQSQEQTFALQTSGSTGTPKTITVKRTQMEASAKGTIGFLGLQPGQKAILCLNPAFIAGKMMMVRAFMAHMQLISLPVNNNPLQYYEDDLEQAFIALVPLQLQQMIQHPNSLRQLNTMHSVIIGGGPVSATLEEATQQLQCAVYHTFGMTETLSHIALRRMNGPQRTAHYELIPGNEIKTDERKCLCIKGEVTQHQWIATNDLVEIEDRSFRWLGRLDNVINSGGIKISPETLEPEIKKILEANGFPERNFVTGVPDETLGQKMVLVIETSEMTEISKTDLMETLKKNLPPYKAPKAIYTISAFKMTPTGKIQRKETLKRILS